MSNPVSLMYRTVSGVPRLIRHAPRELAKWNCCTMLPPAAPCCMKLTFAKMAGKFNQYYNRRVDPPAWETLNGATSRIVRWKHTFGWWDDDITSDDGTGDWDGRLFVTPDWNTGLLRWRIEVWPLGYDPTNIHCSVRLYGMCGSATNPTPSWFLYHPEFNDCMDHDCGPGYTNSCSLLVMYNGNPDLTLFTRAYVEECDATCEEAFGAIPGP